MYWFRLSKHYIISQEYIQCLRYELKWAEQTVPLIEKSCSLLFLRLVGCRQSVSIYLLCAQSSLSIFVNAKILIWSYKISLFVFTKIVLEGRYLRDDFALNNTILLGIYLPRIDLVHDAGKWFASILYAYTIFRWAKRIRRLFLVILKSSAESHQPHLIGRSIFTPGQQHDYQGNNACIIT